MNVAQHKIVNLLKTLWCSSVFVSVWVFNVWPKTTLLPVRPRDASRLDTPDRIDRVWQESGLLECDVVMLQNCMLMVL